MGTLTGADFNKQRGGPASLQEIRPPPRRLTLTWGPSSHASESLGSVCCFNPEFLSCKTRSCQERSRKSVKRAVRQDPALPGRGQSCLMVVGVVSSRTLCPGNRPGAQGCGARAERGARPPEGTGLRRDAPPPKPAGLSPVSPGALSTDCAQSGTIWNFCRSACLASLSDAAAKVAGPGGEGGGSTVVSLSPASGAIVLSCVCATWLSFPSCVICPNDPYTEGGSARHPCVPAPAS